MENYPSVQRLAFDHFNRRVFQPSLARVQQEDEMCGPDRLISIATMFESMFWLHAGVMYRFFPGEESSTALAQTWDRLFVPRVDKFLRHFGNLFPQWAIRPLTESPWVIRSPRPEHEIGSPGPLQKQFQLAYTYGSNAFRSSSIGVFSAGILLSDAKRWKHLLAVPFDENELSRAVIGYSVDPWCDGNRSLVYAGWLDLIRHIEGLFELFSSEKCPIESSDDDWVALRVCVASLHGWRIGIADERGRSRFQEIGKPVLSLVRSNIDSLKLGVDLHQIDSYLPIFINRWKRFSTFLSSEASA